MGPKLVIVKRLSRGYSAALFDGGEMAPPLFEREGSLRALASLLTAWGRAHDVGQAVGISATGNVDDALTDKVARLVGLL
jgi:hypothetical protein